MFKILIKNLNLFGYHGVKESEKSEGQNFRFNIEVFIKKDDFSKYDSIEDTVNYSEIIKLVKRINGSSSFDLLETLAQEIAGQIEKMSPLIGKVAVKIEKTSPPIKENLGSVGVEYVLNSEEKAKTTLKKTAADVYLSVGSNMGGREDNLRKAADMIEANPNINVIKVSSIYETEPMYVKDQNYFYNIVLQCLVDKKLGPFEMMGFLKGVEHKLGRLKIDKKYGPRIIDIDLLYYGKTTLQSDFLTVPHLKITERKFVLLPLSEIAPDFKIKGKNIKEILKNTTLTGKVTRVKSW
jgi:dihydroneopterin aldolase/2-amino-4-hydroxy-6-hydroxymethyldihydropteridine diphosphokinase